MTTRNRLPWSDIAAIVSLALLAILFFWRILLTNQVLVGVDLLGYFYPYRDLVSDALREGRLPLWNPYLFMGAPLLANSQAAVLYPLHWPLMWLSVPKQIGWSIFVHIWLAAVGAYLFARRAVMLRPVAAWLTAVVFGFGGFLGAQVEHINQLNASAWLPWLLLSLHTAAAGGRRKWPAVLGGAATVALTLLAGHGQAAYIVFLGALMFACLTGVLELVGARDRAPRPRGRARWASLNGIAMLALMGTGGILLSAGQLLPMLELSRLSVRSGGLPYSEAASFSLKPHLVHKAFLPPLLWEPPYSEYTAYLGLLALGLAGLATWYLTRHARPGDLASPLGQSEKRQGIAMLVVAACGVFLAFGAYNPVYYLLYQAVPAFDLFRVPARWLLLYAFGAAVLAGMGLQALRAQKRWHAGIALLVVVELMVARRQLAYNRPTAPTAFESLRSAPAHLLSDTSPEPFRFLSMSDILYDPGDLGDLTAMYDDSLSEQAVYDLLVATKMKEVLAYNLPALYRLSSIDGYDGGLLPTAQYINLERLFLPAGAIWTDGRLRQQLSRVPPARLLSLLNVKYVITDKLQDAWIDGVYYDLEHTVSLAEITLDEIPSFSTTHLGVVSYLTDTAGLPDGSPVAEVIVTSSAGQQVTATLVAGLDTAEGVYRPGSVPHRQARVGHHWPDSEKGTDYVAILDLGGALQPVQIALRSLLPSSGGQLLLRGLSLIDERTGTSRTLCVDPAYTTVHSGDVKIYKNLAVQPRAYVAYQAHVLADDEPALALLANPGFDSANRVIVSAGRELASSLDAQPAQILAYTPEHVELLAILDAPGYLVLSDAYFPGWAAEVNGRPADLVRANVYFRAVELGQGTHRVLLRYQPESVRLGLAIQVTAWCLWFLLAIATGHIGRRRELRV